MLTDATLTAIVPVYNRPTVVLEALDSIAAQATPPDRLVVVDDGSDDGTVANVRRWLEEHGERCGGELIEVDHGGAPRAINAGVERACDCQVMGILDSDDLWPPDYVQAMKRAMAEDADAVAATCDKVSISYPGERREMVRLDSIPPDATEWIFRHGAAGQSNTVFRVETVRAIGGFNPETRTGSDLDLMLRLSVHGRWRHVPGPVVTYRDGYARHKGEAGPLSHQYPDRRLRRVRAMETTLFESGVAEAIDDAVWRPKLGAMWFKAGKQLAKAGDKARARDCFAEAVRYAPGHLRARLRNWFG